MKSQRVIPFLLIVVCCLLTAHPVTKLRADGAPPPFAPGSGIGPTVPTKVRMVSETVTVTVNALSGGTTKNVFDDNAFVEAAHDIWPWMDATVEATFTLRNLGTQDEAFAVWFPLGDAWESGYPTGVVNLDISDFAAWVNGQPATSTKQPPRDPSATVAGDGLDPFSSNMATDTEWYNHVPWATWPVTFPVGKDVLVRVTYTLFPVAETRPVGDFTYILQTGAGWNDTIGEGTVTFKLPYQVSFVNAAVESWQNGYQVNGDQISWHFTDLKPTKLNNITICVVEPDRWNAWLDARQAVAQSPDSAAAWFQYALALYRISAAGADGSRQCGVSPDDPAMKNAHDRMLALAPADRRDLYDKYAWDPTRAAVTNKETDRQALLDNVAKDFQRWPDDPVFQVIQGILKSPDYLSY
ncbi:MAG TPA: hypothetical protein VKQ72_19955 [Aggregatilineales bacterium]|nr:hypothetical protein [Aggregatilineales bacterium]